LLPDIFAPEVEALVGTAGEVRIEMLAEERICGFGSDAARSEPGTDRSAEAFLFAMDDVGGE
jgi:hypothetical protein